MIQRDDPKDAVLLSLIIKPGATTLNLGPYERNCKAHWVTPDDPIPDDFSFQLFPDDLDRLEFYIEDAMARVPLLGSSHHVVSL
ncbi:MAG: hypothetical protein AAGC99_24225 [Pseudomonadota bacterium]